MIIGIAGRAGAGKTTTADYLVTKGFVKDAYAKTLKEAAAIIFNVPLEIFLGDIKVKSQIDPYWNMTYRQMLQLLGTEACRNTFGTNIWERAFWRRHKDVNYDLVIEDVRFPNEAEAVLSRDGIVIEIVRDDIGHGHHASEIPLPEKLVSKYIMNSGTLKNLYARLELLI